MAVIIPQSFVEPIMMTRWESGEHDVTRSANSKRNKISVSRLTDIPGTRSVNPDQHILDDECVISSADNGVLSYISRFTLNLAASRHSA